MAGDRMTKPPEECKGTAHEFPLGADQCACKRMMVALLANGNRIVVPTNSPIIRAPQVESLPAFDSTRGPDDSTLRLHLSDIDGDAMHQALQRDFRTAMNERNAAVERLLTFEALFGKDITAKEIQRRLTKHSQNELELQAQVDNLRAIESETPLATGLFLYYMENTTISVPDAGDSAVVDTTELFVAKVRERTLFALKALRKLGGLS